MKICTRCKKEKPIEEFSVKRKVKRQPWCKVCVQQYDRLRYVNSDKAPRVKRNKQRREASKRLLLQWLDGKSCLTCDESDIVVLEFDHRDPRTKCFEIGDGIRRGLAWSTILAEIAKCDLLCANCHRRKTAKQLGWFRSTTG